MNFARRVLVVLLCLAPAGLLASEVETQQFLKRYCVDCHAGKDAEGNLRVDQLTSPLAKAEIAAWEKMAQRIATRDMPPAEMPQPSAKERKQLLHWIGQQLSQAVPRMPALRRLNRTEYEYTLQDLLGIDTALADYLPEDSSVQGFDNVAGGLGLSPVLLQRYLEAADAAFDGVIRRIKPSEIKTRRAVLMEDKSNKDSVAKNKGGVIESHGALVDFTPGWPPARIDAAHPIEPGVYRCRVAVWPHEPNAHRTLSVACFTGPLFGPGSRKFQGMYDATGTPENPRIIEFTARLDAGETIHILPWIYPEHVTWRDKEEARPGVAILWAETHGPLDQSFPSLAQQQLFGEGESLKMEPAGSYYLRHRRGVRSHSVVSENPSADAERIIREFIPRAFRRPVEKHLADQFVELTLQRLEQGRSFEQAVRAGVTAVLCSPHFLLLNAETEVDDHNLASRLSYFLWSSLPDEELLQLAADGKLSDPAVRHAQIERMIQDPKIERFVKNFTGQWCDLREIEFTTPDKKLYPEYDELLMRSMLAETRGFFRHILMHNLSVQNFVDSDFAILNQRLATHYGIEGVRGHEEFRVVKLPPDSIRGGLLTQASILKVTANGTSTSPVIRGVWVLENFLAQPSPPPPAGVPAVEPDIRGATTIREQLKLHSENSACALCHRRIDPPGFALEEFDVIGGHRQWYRSLGSKGDKVPKTNYRVGPQVELGGELPDGTKFSNFVAYRDKLAAEPEIIVQALAKKLLVYGCGRPLTPADQPIIDQVVESAQQNGAGLKDLIHAVVDSDLFLAP